MSFNYEKVKSKLTDAHGNSWTAYSDLFMMLSTVFLLLYVSVSLRSQTNGVEVQQKLKQLTSQNADLEEQIQVYNTLRDNHMKKEASEKEQEAYQKLMGKLDLLKEEAGEEKDKLRKQAKDNENKEYALNEYQKMIRNIINTNILSKTTLQRRDFVNAEQKQTIVGQVGQISNLNQEVAQREQEIAQNKDQIDRINFQLNKKIKSLHEQQRAADITKAQMNKKIAALKVQSEKTLRNLESKNQEAQNELNQVQANLTATQQQAEKAQKEAQAKGQALAQTKEQLAATTTEYEKKLAGTKSQYEQQLADEKAEFEDQIAGTKAQSAQQVAAAKAGFAAKEAQIKANFENALSKERMSGAEKEKKMAEFTAAAKAREGEMNGKLNELGQKAAQLGARADKAEAEKGRALATVQGLEKENSGLSADLKRANEIAKAKEDLANKIRGELKKAGLSGTVDKKTGDVTLAFGEEGYFDTGSANIKPSMMNTLKKFMPGYSKSLFGDPKIAKNIDNVEIIGFSSSTYRGRYVPPDSLRPEDQEAINYNLKLSSDRANAIFKQIFDTKKMSFEHQRDLLPKIKVVGRGYLPDGTSGNDFKPGMTDKEFCTKFNCNQSQKVIIKFKLKD